MKHPTDILPKKLKFTKFNKYDLQRKNTKALSIGSNIGAPTYINVNLAAYFRKHNVTAVNIMTDVENEAIAIEISNDENGFKLVPTGKRGVSVNARLGSVLPVGRYIYMKEQSTDKVLIFAREYSTTSLYIKGEK